MTTITTPTAVVSTTVAPRRNWLKWLSVAIGTIGLLDTIYLTYSKLADSATVCPANGTFNCELVQHSIYSQIAGIPIVYIGLAGYLGIMAVLLLDGRVSFFTQRGALIVFGMALFGFLYSLYLTSIEAFVLHAWCMWCLLSATAMTALFLLSAMRVWHQFTAVTFDEGDITEGE